MAVVENRERAVADHVLRYGLTTCEALRPLVFPDMTAKAASRLTERLVETSWLSRRRLPGNGRYFVLGERAAKELAVPIGRAYGYQALISRVGVLYFCARHGAQVFRPAEFRERFPELSKAGFTTSNYYVDSGDKARLGFIHVDHGRTSQRLATKLMSRVVSRYRDEDFAGIIQQDRFLIAIVTSTEDKTRSIREELEGRGPGPVRFRVETVPELMPLLIDAPPRSRRTGDA